MNLSVIRKGEWLECLIGEPIESEDMSISWLRQHTRFPEKYIAFLIMHHKVKWQGNRLMLHLFPPEKDDYVPEWMALDILYEDDFCLVVHKPAGILVHPSTTNGRGTLANAVAGYFESTGQLCKVRHIHRLDEYTSGPVLYAKNEVAQQIMDEHMRNKEIERIYVAIVHGNVRDDFGKLVGPIGRDRHHNARMRVSPSGKPAVTHYETLERFHNATLVRLRLETGRTHQIRVHLHHLGHPIMGDTLYGGKIDFIQRQALHGEQLCFTHPLYLDKITLQSPWPEDMQLLRERLKNN